MKTRYPLRAVFDRMSATQTLDTACGYRERMLRIWL